MERPDAAQSSQSGATVQEPAAAPLPPQEQNPDKRDKAQTVGEKLLPFVGITPAPKYITEEPKAHR